MTTLEHKLQQSYLGLIDEIDSQCIPIPADVLSRMQIAIRLLQEAVAELNEENYVPVTKITRH